MKCPTWLRREAVVMEYGDFARFVAAQLAIDRHVLLILRRLASVNDETANVHLGDAGTILNMFEAIERRWDATPEPEPEPAIKASTAKGKGRKVG